MTGPKVELSAAIREYLRLYLLAANVKAYRHPGDDHDTVAARCAPLLAEHLTARLAATPQVGVSVEAVAHLAAKLAVRSDDTAMRHTIYDDGLSAAYDAAADELRALLPTDHEGRTQ